MAARRADSFQAGTPVVWDVDPQARCVRAYRNGPPDQPVTFAKGHQADADPEPAVLGWRLAPDEIFPRSPGEDGGKTTYLIRRKGAERTGRIAAPGG